MTRIRARASTRVACGWSLPLARASLQIFAARGLACRLLSAKVVIATRNRWLQAQRKCTARCLPDSPGDGGAAGEGGDGAGVPAGLPGIAPLGEHPGSVDLTRPGQRREDRAVRVLHEVGGDGAVEVLHRGVQGY